MTSTHTRIAELLTACGTPQGVLPPTALYNEGWMLRLVLDWFAHHPEVDHPLAFMPGAGWFSEVLLPSQFRPRSRGDTLAEAWTHADGIIGHVGVRTGRGDVQLKTGGRQFVVAEAKMFSGLSGGTRRATTFDQAARNVACMAEVLHQHSASPETLDHLAFIVVAPREQIIAGMFGNLCERSAIAEKVRLRVASYAGEKETWYRDAFLPTLERVELHVLAWEDVVAEIERQDAPSGAELRAFLSRCLDANRPRASARGIAPETLTKASYP